MNLNLMLVKMLLKLFENLLTAINKLNIREEF